MGKWDQYREEPQAPAASKWDQYREQSVSEEVGINISPINPTLKNMTTLEEYAKTKGYEYKELSPQDKASLIRTGLETGLPLFAAITSPEKIGIPALSYIAGKKIADIYEQSQGLQKPPTVKEEATELLTKDIPVGLTTEIVPPIAQKAIGAAGKLIAGIWGRLTGTGQTAIEESVKSGLQTGLTKNPFASQTKYDEALRSKITGDEVVQHAKSALNTIKDNRGNAYRAELANLQQNRQPIDIASLKQDYITLLKKYVRIDKSGQIDWARSAIGPENSEGIRKIQQITDIIQDWGSRPEDRTAVGLDMLKRQLDEFFSESSNARAFVTSFRNKVKDTIINNVPEYRDMMKNYEEATTIIKDIESGLMMRKQGISGRITADQTLRRLMSAMRDNFPLRKDLVEALGTQGGQDIIGEVAGHSMNTLIPRGLAGTGPALIGEAAIAQFITPKFWPVLAMSSPRLSGEFLRMYGKYLAETKGLMSPIIKGTMIEGMRRSQPEAPQ